MSTVRWWKNGDHPDDKSAPGPEGMSEGRVVRFYSVENPHALCPQCSAAYGVHGLVSEQVVHPGDYITTTGDTHEVWRVEPLEEHEIRSSEKP